MRRKTKNLNDQHIFKDFYFPVNESEDERDYWIEVRKFVNKVWDKVDDSVYDNIEVKIAEAIHDEIYDVLSKHNNIPMHLYPDVFEEIENSMIERYGLFKR